LEWLKVCRSFAGGKLASSWPHSTVMLLAVSAFQYETQFRINFASDLIVMSQA